MVAISGIAKPVNEPNLDYSPGSPERGELEERLCELEGRVIEIPAIVSGEEWRPGEAFDVVMPHKHGHVLAEGYLADKGTIEEAIESSLEAKAGYLELPADERASIFMRAAELLSGPQRATMNAATMLGLSKTVYEAEIDTAELIDMLRFNASWMAEIRGQQPLSVEGVRNRVDYRPLDGFVLARGESPHGPGDHGERGRLEAGDQRPILRLFLHEGAAGGGAPRWRDQLRPR